MNPAQPRTASEEGEGGPAGPRSPASGVGRDASTPQLSGGVLSAFLVKMKEARDAKS